MAAASLSRRISRSFFSLSKPSLISMNFSTNLSPHEEEPDIDADTDLSQPESDRNSSSSTSSDPKLVRSPFFQRPLENGLDIGVYKAILVGQVGQNPVQKRLKSGRVVTLFSVGTGGIRNNRRPLDNEEPMEYADRCSVQWHRVSVYPERLGELAQKHVKPGCILYLEGNLETKVFSDPITGLVRRIREIALRRDGRLVFLGKESDEAQSTQSDLRRAGYY
ncbi:nucleic acid-binding, OB-fold-like protein [Tasmannia lanceolata]|uniref:nucleic acid-binding, OB-fold-like protein n=1 Tax=Tasmannia lanceolata TaxID=3420 RepID=UPI004063FD89